MASCFTLKASTTQCVCKLLAVKRSNHVRVHSGRHNTTLGIDGTERTTMWGSVGRETWGTPFTVMRKYLDLVSTMTLESRGNEKHCWTTARVLAMSFMRCFAPSTKSGSSGSFSKEVIMTSTRFSIADTTSSSPGGVGLLADDEVGVFVLLSLVVLVEESQTRVWLRSRSKTSVDGYNCLDQYYWYCFR